MRATGDEVELLADDDRPGGWLLLLDRVRQSYIDLDDPTYLEFPYVQVLAATVAALPAGPLDVVHIGGGGATLARWIAATRPGSSQLVAESHGELHRIVRDRLPVEPSSGIDLRHGDGRSVLAELPDDSVDVVVIDAFSGGRVPGDLTTVEALGDARRILRSSGLLLMNVTAAAESRYLRRLVAALAGPFAELVLQGDQHGAVGNLVIVAAGPDQLPAGVIVEDGLLGPPLPLTGESLRSFVGAVSPLSVDSPMRSPEPPEESWRVHTDFDPN